MYDIELSFQTFPFGGRPRGFVRSGVVLPAAGCESVEAAPTAVPTVPTVPTVVAAVVAALVAPPMPTTMATNELDRVSHTLPFGGRPRGL